MDVDWADNVSNKISTNGFMFSFGSGVISWSHKKQPTFALSSTEAKYRGIRIAICEVVWLQKTALKFGTINGCSCCHLL
jgi:hypothetical protein